MNNENTTVAELLKSARVERGLSLKVIASDICVRSSYLTAIEEADYDALPGKTFAIGFVKAYAAAVGEDPVKVVEAFKLEYCPEISSLQSTQVMKASKPARKVPGWLAPITGLLGVGACWMLLGGSIGTSLMVTSTAANNVAIEEARLAEVQANIAEPQSDAVETVEVVSLAVVEQPVDAEPVETTRSFFTPAVYADGDTSTSVAGNFILEAVEDSWVRVAHEDGTEMWSGILREGQTYRPQAEGRLLLSTSNAGGVMLQQAGAEATLLGARGDIVSDMQLENETLLSEQDLAELSEFGSE